MTASLRGRVVLCLVSFWAASGLWLQAAQAPAPGGPRPPTASNGPAPPPSGSPAGSVATAPLTQAIPVDPLITTGRFANGLRYYVRQNSMPKNRAELRLVVNAGSLLEDDDQRGLAHFVEHMAFNGTTHFPKLQLVEFMESIGMRFGPSVNASTSFDETIYMLTIPTDKPEVTEKAMLILEDWAQNLSFDPVEIDKERGVIMEEWRLGRGASMRMLDKQLPILLQGSRYADRLAIGKPEVIQNFKHDRLTQFYKDWYRPDLMAVIAVGDFDKAAMQTLIAKHFGTIPARRGAKPRPVFDVPVRPGTSFAIASDPEASSTSVAVYKLEKATDQSTIGAYRQQIVRSLYSGMLSSRFGEMAQKPNAPFLGADAEHGDMVRTSRATILSAAVKPEGIEQGLEALFVEASRVGRFGFTATELEREKTNLLRSLERAVAERNNQPSAALAAELGRNFLEQEPIPGIVYEQALYQRFLPQITLTEINALARTWSSDGSRVVTVNAPEKTGLTIPTAERLTTIMSAAPEKATAAYTDTVEARPLLATQPTAGSVTSTRSRPAMGITEWTLSNGARVVLRPTDFKQDEVVFSAYSYGGTSLASDSDFISAGAAGQVIAAGGLGSLNAIDLRKVLTGKAATVRPNISGLTEGVSGSGSPKDLETLFQLVYLTFTAPRADADVFEVLKTQTKTALTAQAARPEFVFSQELNKTLTQDHPRARTLTAERVDEMNLDKALAFYKDRFADASDFTFFFVGSFDLATIRPLVERYLASLPATRRSESWKDVGVRYPTGVVTRRVSKGIEPKSQEAMVFTGPFEFNPDNRAVMRALGLVLEDRLRLSLREELGGTYTYTASPSMSRIPRSEYSFSISFTCNPERADALVQRVLDEIEKLKSTGPTPGEINDAKQAMLRDFETGMRQNGYLMQQISGRYQSNEDVEGLASIPDLYSRLDAAQVQAAARSYFNVNNYVRVTLVPER